MGSIKERRRSFKLDAKTAILSTIPTERNVLIQISKDGTTFNMGFMVDVLKTLPQRPDPNSNIVRAIAIFREGIEKGYIKDDALENKLTLKGKWHLIATHPHREMWAIIIAIIIGSAPFIVTVATSRKEKLKPTQAATSTPELKMKYSRPHHLETVIDYDSASLKNILKDTTLTKLKTWKQNLK